MQIETLKQAGAIYLEQIQEGFDQCDWVEFTLDAGEAVDKLSAEWEACGKENAWADFYYFTLPDEAKEKIRESLTEEENRYLKELEAEEDGIIFPLEERLLRLLAKLNETEMLFSTFYFTNPASTWWGGRRCGAGGAGAEPRGTARAPGGTPPLHRRLRGSDVRGGGLRGSAAPRRAAAAPAPAFSTTRTWTPGPPSPCARGQRKAGAAAPPGAGGGQRGTPRGRGGGLRGAARWGR